MLSASDDSNINVWSLARLLEPGQDIGLEPELTLSNHRAAITDLVVGPSTNPETCICVSASKDKTCIVWNYQSGQVLRTLLFPTAPLCISLDPCARALLVSCEDGGVFLVDFFGEKPLLGPHSAELASIVVQVNSPLGVADADAGPASCMALTYDGTAVVTGHTKGKIFRWTLADNSHPTELANLNASVTNLIFTPLLSDKEFCQAINVVKPNQAQRQYTLSAQLEGDLDSNTRFNQMLNSKGFSAGTIAQALESFSSPEPSSGDVESELRKQNDELQEIINEQKALHKATLERHAEANKNP